MITAQDIIKTLVLAPLPLEGGYYAETYRSAFGTAIYYLLTEDSYSAMHRLPGDEIFHFYLGDPVEMLQLRPDGTGEVLTLGPDLLRGMQLQTMVAGGVWQGIAALCRRLLRAYGNHHGSGIRLCRLYGRRWGAAFCRISAACRPDQKAD